MSGSAARNSLADIFAASGELPPHPLLERIQRNPVGMNRFEDSMTVPTPGIDPLAGFVGGVPVTQGQAASLPVDPVSGRLNEGGLMMANSLMGASSGVVPKAAAGFRAFHGTPHEFDRFSSAKIGTGEGAQAYGRGLYFAENEGVARSYRDALATDPRDTLNKYLTGIGNFHTPNDPALTFEAIKTGLSRHDDLAMRQLGANDKAVQDILEVARGYDAASGTHSDAAMAAFQRLDAAMPAKTAGHMYEVNINAPPEHFLDWDAPISQQSQTVRDRLTDLLRVHKVPKNNNAGGETTGSQLYGYLIDRFGGDQSEATKELLGEGLAGIRYLDQGSRGAGGGSRNTVVFDDATIEILRKYGLAGLMAGGAGAAAAGSGDGDPPL